MFTNELCKLLNLSMMQNTEAYCEQYKCVLFCKTQYTGAYYELR